MPRYCVIYVREKVGVPPRFGRKEISTESPLDSMENIGMAERELSSSLGGVNVTILGCIPLKE
jgi:hypothetical protein